MIVERYQKYEGIILRTGLAVVLLWFGFSQLKDPSGWTGMIPGYVSSMFSNLNMLIYFNGAFEIFFASLLILGIFTRFTSGILFLHMIHIVTIVGYGPIAFRDLAIALALLSIFFRGADEFSLDRIIFRKNI